MELNIGTLFIRKSSGIMWKVIEVTEDGKFVMTTGSAQRTYTDEQIAKSFKPYQR